MVCKVEKEFNDPQMKEKIDTREALYNGGQIGPIRNIQASKVLVTHLRGILLDIDPKMYRESTLIPELPGDPVEFYEVVAKEWLSRHPVLEKAEVRCSGHGLHGLLWFDKPVRIASEGERKRWKGRIQVIQTCLPSDPGAPTLVANTRPLDSFNGKDPENPIEVTQLREGTPMEWAEIETLYRDMEKQPFRTVLQILSGSEGCKPCPICKAKNSCLTASDFNGKCNKQKCGKAILSQLYDIVFEPKATVATEGECHE